MIGDRDSIDTKSCFKLPCCGVSEGWLVQDDDLIKLRDQEEWRDILEDLKGSMSKDMLVSLKSEVKVLS